MSLGTAFRAFWRSLTDPKFANQAESLLTGGALPAAATTPTPPAEPAAPPAPPPPKKPGAEALQILALLQRDGRLLDFLTEEIKDYSDDQIGAAVRDIHRDCQAVVTKYLELSPVRSESEGARVTVPVGFDSNAIRLTGAVKGSAPYSGTVAHPGWRVKEVKLPPIPEGQDPFLLAPAEIEIT